MFLTATLNNITKQSLLFFTLLLSLNSTERTFAYKQSTKTTPKAITQQPKKAEANLSLSAKNRKLKSIIKWGTILTIALFYTYILYQIMQYKSGIYIPNREELHDMVPPYIIGDEPIESIKALLNDEEKDQLDSYIDVIEEAENKRSMLELIIGKKAINSFLKKKNIKGKLAVDFYAHFIQLYSQEETVAEKVETHLLGGLSLLEEPLTEHFLADLFLTRGESADSTQPVRLGGIITRLARIAPTKAIQIATGLIRNGDHHIQKKIITSLGYSEIPKVISNPTLLNLLSETLYQALESENKEVKIEAIRSIGKQAIKNDKIIKNLLAKVKGSSPDVRIHKQAIEALSKLAIAEIITDCIDILENHDDKELKKTAAKAIFQLIKKKKIGKEHLPTLKNIYEEEYIEDIEDLSSSIPHWLKQAIKKLEEVVE